MSSVCRIVSILWTWILCTDWLLKSQIYAYGKRYLFKIYRSRTSKYSHICWCYMTSLWIKWIFSTTSLFDESFLRLWGTYLQTETIFWYSKKNHGGVILVPIFHVLNNSLKRKSNTGYMYLWEIVGFQKYFISKKKWLKWGQLIFISYSCYKKYES